MMNKKLYSQHGEDLIIKCYFPEDYKGICVGVGESDGIANSNTKLFEDSGWTSINIEPNPWLFSELKRNRNGLNFNVACGSENRYSQEFAVVELNSGNQRSVSSLKLDERLVNQHNHCIKDIREINVEVKTLDSILEECGVDRLDFISIDTEGTELDVLKGCTLDRWEPKLLVIENNFKEYEISKYLQDRGYVFNTRLAVNDFFIREK